MRKQNGGYTSYPMMACTLAGEGAILNVRFRARTRHSRSPGTSYRWSREGHPPGQVQAATTRASQVPSWLALLDGGVECDHQESDPSERQGKWVIGAQGFFILSCQFEAQSEVQIQTVSEGRGRPPGARGGAGFRLAVSGAGN